MTYRVKARILAGRERGIVIPTKHLGGPNLRTIMYIKYACGCNPYRAFGIKRFRRYSSLERTCEAVKACRVRYGWIPLRAYVEHLRLCA